MPGKNGLDVLKYMNEEELTNRISVIMITGEATVDSDVKAYELGVADIIYKPFDAAVVIRRTLNIIELYEHRIHLEQKLEKRTAQLRESQEKLEKITNFISIAMTYADITMRGTTAMDIPTILWERQLSLSCLH